MPLQDLHPPWSFLYHFSSVSLLTACGKTTSFGADRINVQSTSMSSPSVSSLSIPTQPHMGGVVELENIMKNSVKDPDNYVFLYLDERRNYMLEELDALTRRHFETKLFMTAIPFVWDTFFLRTHHMDNSKQASRFRYIWAYIKAAYATRVQTCVNATFTTLLTKNIFELDWLMPFCYLISIRSVEVWRKHHVQNQWCHGREPKGGWCRLREVLSFYGCFIK